jgi:hypothetical protein
MIRHLFACAALLLVVLPASAQKITLITAAEAALPPSSGVMATRGITRGPGVKLLSPEADTPVKAPFNLKFGFEGRGGEKIDPASVRVVYLKTPSVDLTPRLQSAISASGIDVAQTDVPPGEHQLRVTVKDSAGRETNSTLTIVVTK